MLLGEETNAGSPHVNLRQRSAVFLLLLSLGLAGIGCSGVQHASRETPAAHEPAPAVVRPAEPATDPAIPSAPPYEPTTRAGKLARAALAQVGRTRFYDPAYVRIAYPGGDVPLERGVCTDVVVRAMRELGFDLQVLVHEDMKAAFDRYPKTWGLKAPDPNIDHRRVPNLATFFSRKGKALPATEDPKDYYPGDFVTWTVPVNRPHIGIVSDIFAEGSNRYLVIHNIGFGTQIEDELFGFEVTGHFRYFDDAKDAHAEALFYRQAHAASGDAGGS